MLRTAWPALHGLPDVTARSLRSVSVRRMSEDAKQQLTRRLLDSSSPVRSDTFEPGRLALLHLTLKEFLPPFEGPRPRRAFIETWAINPGHHLIYFASMIPTRQLLPDGTDELLSPGHPWTQRLWAGGRIQFPQKRGLGTPTTKPRMGRLIEYVRDVRVAGPDGQEKIFVKMERRVGKLLPRETDEATIQRLRRESEDDLENSLIVESRELCFLRANEPGTSAFKKRSAIRPPSDPEFSHTLVPTPALLFRYSALTFNAHAIHIDPEYTRDVYGLPKLLVHGPLALTLMLDYLRRILQVVMVERNGPVMIITEINYRNLAPLFVNEEMTICCKRKPSNSDSQASPTSKSFVADQGHVDASEEHWDIWIQTGHGEEVSLAVRGTVKVERDLPAPEGVETDEEEDRIFRKVKHEVPDKIQVEGERDTAGPRIWRTYHTSPRKTKPGSHAQKQ